MRVKLTIKTLAIAFLFLLGINAWAVDLKQLQEQLRKVNDEIAVLVDQADDGVITGEEYKKLFEPMAKRQAVIGAEINAIRIAPIIRRLEALERGPKNYYTNSEINDLESMLMKMDRVNYYNYLQNKKGTKEAREARRARLRGMKVEGKSVLRTMRDAINEKRGGPKAGPK